MKRSFLMTSLIAVFSLVSFAQAAPASLVTMPGTSFVPPNTIDAGSAAQNTVLSYLDFNTKVNEDALKIAVDEGQRGTQLQFANSFQISLDSFNEVILWMQSVGLTINNTGLATSTSVRPPNIQFQGTVQQIENLFHITIHQYRSSDDSVCLGTPDNIQLPANIAALYSPGSSWFSCEKVFPLSGQPVAITNVANAPSLWIRLLFQIENLLGSIGTFFLKFFNLP